MRFVLLCFQNTENVNNRYHFTIICVYDSLKLILVMYRSSDTMKSNW